MKEERRVDLVFSGVDVLKYKELEERAKRNGSSIQDEINKLIK